MVVNVSNVNTNCVGAALSVQTNKKRNVALLKAFFLKLRYMFLYTKRG